MADYAGSISLSQARDLSHTSDDEEDDRHTPHTAPPLAQPSKLRITTITATRATASGGSDAAAAPRKPRGRPPGSKNRPKPPVVLTRESESGMKSAVLEISAGSDIVDAVVQFGRRHQVGVSIISGSGSVSNVTLRHPASHAPAMTLHGPFNILSLTGTFVGPSSSSSSYSPAASCSFGISLAGQQGQVFGGIVGGKVTAATPVVLVVATFLNPSFHRLPGEFEEAAAGEDPPAKGRVSGGGAGEGGCSTTAMSVYVGASPSPLNSQAPPGDVLPWSSTCRPPQPNY